MKINWGTGIVIAFVCFISFILFFVIKMNTNDKYSHDLVTEEYYKQELAYQQQINEQKNAVLLGKELSVELKSQMICITFPKSKDLNKLTGNVEFYRPSDKSQDFKTPIQLKQGRQFLIPTHKLAKGRWNLTVRWSISDQNYTVIKQLNL